MAFFYMMFGLPGSGKSYWADELAKQHNAVVFSSDALRAELFGSEEDQEHNGEVFNELQRRILSALKDNKNVIYDATNLSSKRRKIFLNQLPKNIYRVIYVVATDYEVCLRQNNNRSRHVPEEVIERMYKQMQMPRKAEGWDDIRYISSVRNNSNIVNVLSPCVNFDQDNPHHSNTLFDHMLEAANYVQNNYEKFELNRREMAIVYIAALFHDIGKVDTKTYKLWSGKIDSHAHYYGHADVGAYKIACLFHDVPWEDNQEWIIILKLIMYHMDSYSNPNFLDAVQKIEGKRFRQMLELLHEGDLNGH